MEHISKKDLKDILSRIDINQGELCIVNEFGLEYKEITFADLETLLIDKTVEFERLEVASNSIIQRHKLDTDEWLYICKRTKK